MTEKLFFKFMKEAIQVVPDVYQISRNEHLAGQFSEIDVIFLLVSKR